MTFVRGLCKRLWNKIVWLGTTLIYQSNLTAWQKKFNQDCAQLESLNENNINKWETTVQITIGNAVSRVDSDTSRNFTILNKHLKNFPGIRTQDVRT